VNRQLLRLLRTHILVHKSLALKLNTKVSKILYQWILVLKPFCFLWNIIFTFYYMRVRLQCDYSILGRLAEWLELANVVLKFSNGHVVPLWDKWTGSAGRPSQSHPVPPNLKTHLSQSHPVPPNLKTPLSQSHPVPPSMETPLSQSHLCNVLQPETVPFDCTTCPFRTPFSQCGSQFQVFCGFLIVIPLFDKHFWLKCFHQSTIILKSVIN